MTQHGERQDINWYPEELFAARFAADSLEVSSDADDFDPDSLTEPCMSYTRDDRVAALKAENERLREAALHLLETVHRADLTKTEKVEATKRQLESRFLAGAARTILMDRERLDWLEGEAAHLGNLNISIGMYADGSFGAISLNDAEGRDSLRAAIDAAMDREGRGDG